MNIRMYCTAAVILLGVTISGCTKQQPQVTPSQTQGQQTGEQPVGYVVKTHIFVDAEEGDSVDLAGQTVEDQYGNEYKIVKELEVPESVKICRDCDK